MTKLAICLTVNGEPRSWEVDPGDVLLDVLRREGYFGVKRGCETGDCGACTVLLDGRPVDSCLVFAAQAEGCEILTIEGLSQDGKLHPLQEAFLDHGATQCGFCTPGMLLTAKSLLDRSPHPSEQEIREALAGNLCRCTGYVKQVEALLAACNGKGGRS
jgi:aerobic-type carbon monoxide dehydrogenase small subunit (CoxS/CutS family)